LLVGYVLIMKKRNQDLADYAFGTLPMSWLRFDYALT